jgi:nicotinic acid mononucleotide adenylyltransferase
VSAAAGELRERLLESVAEVNAAAVPTARVFGMEPGALRSVAILPGAFNPPTLAHVALARAALGHGFDAALFSIGTRTIDKEDAAGLSIVDRLDVLSRICRSEKRLGVVLQNRGLYVEQADAVGSALPSGCEITFVVGMDKVPQIFDPRYYDDVDAALANLFARAKLLVAARGHLDRDALLALLEEEHAKPHAEGLGWLELAPKWRAISATAVRERLVLGEIPAELLPPEVAAFLETRLAAFAPGPKS